MRTTATKAGAAIACATSFTRTGKLDLTNRKPFRTARQKADARANAYKAEDGTWRSTAPISRHGAFKRGEQ